VWAKQPGGTGYGKGHGIAADSGGNIYLTGEFTGTLNFGSTTLVGSYYDQCFVARMDGNGNWIWANLASMQGGGGIAISVDHANNLLVTGSFYGTAGFGTVSLTSSGNCDIFMAGMDNGGNWLWAKRAGGGGYDYGLGIVGDMDGNVLIIGDFEGTASFGPHMLYCSGPTDAFLAKLDSGGNWIQAIKAGGSGTDDCEGIVLDSTGNAYITGEYRTTAYFGPYSLTTPGGARTYLAKLGVKAISLLSDPALDFGFVTANGKSDWQDVAFSNTGTTSITISGVSISGEPQHFEIDNPPSGLVLAPGESAAFQVRFTPQQAGIFADTLNIANNSANQPDLQVSLAGKAHFELWSGTIVVDQTVIVPHEIILPIAAGTQVQFAPGAGLEVYGSLRAAGTGNAWIHFTAQNAELGWNGLAFLEQNTPADSSYLAYCEISQGVAGGRDLPEGGADPCGRLRFADPGKLHPQPGRGRTRWRPVCIQFLRRVLQLCSSPQFCLQRRRGGLSRKCRSPAGATDDRRQCLDHRPGGNSG